MIRAFALAWLCAAGPAWAVAPPGCPPVEDAGIPRGELSHLAAVLKPGAALNVLVVGPGPAFGGTSAGGAFGAVTEALTPHGAPGPALPASGLAAQMAQGLQGAVPGLRVTLSAVGGNGQTAAVQLGAMKTDLARRRIQLVLWQTGTVDAVSMVAPEDFYQALVDGAGIAASFGADLVLIGPQYSRFLEANANMAPYLAALQEAAALPGVALFDRFGIMRGWVDDGVLDLERTAKAERPAIAARLHACLGQALARMLAAGGS